MHAATRIALSVAQLFSAGDSAAHPSNAAMRHASARHTIAIDAWHETDGLLVSWANRASHTFDLVRPEADKLIEACEKSLEFFRCSSCTKVVWFADAMGKGWVQCQCGQLRWRYGKG